MVILVEDHFFVEDTRLPRALQTLVGQLLNTHP